MVAAFRAGRKDRRPVHAPQHRAAEQEEDRKLVERVVVQIAPEHAEVLRPVEIGVESERRGVRPRPHDDRMKHPDRRR